MASAFHGMISRSDRNALAAPLRQVRVEAGLQQRNLNASTWMLRDETVAGTRIDPPPGHR
jgi:hypothetical protein